MISYIIYSQYVGLKFEMFTYIRQLRTSLSFPVNYAETEITAYCCLLSDLTLSKESGSLNVEF